MKKVKVFSVFLFLLLLSCFGCEGSSATTGAGVRERNDSTNLSGATVVILNGRDNINTRGYAVLANPTPLPVRVEQETLRMLNVYLENDNIEIIFINNVYQDGYLRKCEVYFREK